MTERMHYTTVDVLPIEVASPDGAEIDDGVHVVAGLGTAWRPPLVMASCEWVGDPAATRVFGLMVDPVQDDTPNGVYRVWFRLSGAGVDPLSPLVKADDEVVIYGRPVSS